MPGGDASYFGFEYQIYVSVLVMLQHHQHSDFIELKVETDFGNDAEVIIEKQSIPEHLDDETLDLAVQAKGRLEQIQVKTKGRAYQWQPSEFRKALLKKDERRTHDSEMPNTVLDRLISEPDEKFVFVTDGYVHPNLAELLAEFNTLRRELPDASMLKIKDALVNSVQNDQGLRSTLAQKLNEDVLNRVFIVDGQRLDNIKLRIDALLHRIYGIPAIDTPGKTRHLVDLIRERMLRVNGQNAISSSELEAIVGKVGPFIPYPALRDSFVCTEQYDQAQKCLDENHLVILSGEPGVGKTTIARALINAYSERLYVYKLPSHIDAHLEVMRACRDNRDVVFELDDIFGAVNFDQRRTAFGDHFDQVLDRLQDARGRVKVIITARENILNGAQVNTRMREIKIARYVVSVPYPPDQLTRDILDLLLSQDNDGDSVTASYLDVNGSEFENLLHVREFATMIRKSTPALPTNIADAVNATRPSAYRTWIGMQSEANRLFMYVLWGVIKANQFAWEQDLRRIFDVASTCVILPAYSGFGTRFDIVMADLREQQKRLFVLPNDAIEFIHPQLMMAVEEHLENEPGFRSFVNCLAKTLTQTEDPLAQSVAVMLCLRYQARVQGLLDFLKKLSESHYIQTLETIINFNGVHLIPAKISDEESQEGEESPYRFLYEPYNCEIDADGHLVRKSEDIGFALDLRAKYGGIDHFENNEPELLERFEEVAQNTNLSLLNPLERFRFGQWLYWKQENFSEEDLIKLIWYLAVDSVSFVRRRAARFFGSNESFRLPRSLEIFQNLCFDNHPYVKIEVLEAAILPNWRYQSADVQGEWFRIVVQMLDDPVVRSNTAMGLIDMSGSFYEYQADHTVEQKKQWFIAVAPTLLEYEFEHWDYFDRFLNKFEDYFSELPASFRSELLQAISDYVRSFSEYSEDTLYTIETLLLDKDLTQQEKETTLDLIQNLSAWGQTGLCYTFAREYPRLGDKRLEEFVHRPFYNEEPNEFISERAAALLGFLANDKIKHGDLPAPIRTRKEKDIISNIRDYIFVQNDLFKRMVVFQAFAYEYVYQVNAVHDELYRHEIILELVHYFAQSGTVEDKTLIADVLLRGGYYRFEVKDRYENSKWLELVNLFVYNGDTEVCKRVCEIIFAANIASSVHTTRILLMLIFNYLNHPDLEVQDYAFELFNTNFYMMWTEQVMRSRTPEGLRNEIKQVWFTREFLEKLQEKSQAFHNWTISMSLLRLFEENWSEFEYLKIGAVEFCCILAGSGKRELVELAEVFFEKVQSSLADDLREQLENAIYISEGPTGRRELRGRREQVEKDFKLREFYPKVDWSIYFK